MSSALQSSAWLPTGASRASLPLHVQKLPSISRNHGHHADCADWAVSCFSLVEEASLPQQYPLTIEQLTNPVMLKTMQTNLLPLQDKRAVMGYAPKITPIKYCVPSTAAPGLPVRSLQDQQLAHGVVELGWTHSPSCVKQGNLHRP